MSNQDYTEKAFGKLFQVMSKAETQTTCVPGSKERLGLRMPSLIISGKFTVIIFESALRCGHLTIVKMLVELGASLGIMEEEEMQRSPLHIAAFCGERDICECLITKGADVTLIDSCDKTPLDLALYNGFDACASLLLPSGSSSLRLIRQGTVFPVLLSGWCNRVARRALPSRAERKLESRPNKKSAIMLGDNTAKSCLTIMEGTYDKSSFPEEEEELQKVVHLLLAQSCDVNASRPGNEETALSFVCKLGCRAMVIFLLDHGAGVNCIDKSERTPLHLACSASNASPETIRTLLEHGAEINALDKYGSSPLLVACGQSSTDNIRFLVCHGADANLRENKDRHPLHATCVRDHDPENCNALSSIIDLILDHSEEGILSSECKVASYQFDPYPEASAASPLAIAMWVGNVEAMEALRRQMIQEIRSCKHVGLHHSASFRVGVLLS